MATLLRVSQIACFHHGEGSDNVSVHHGRRSRQSQAKRFGLVARLESRLPWIKVWLLLHLHIDSLPTPNQTDAILLGGCQEVVAKRLSSSVVAQMKIESGLMVDIEKVIVNLL